MNIKLTKEQIAMLRSTDYILCCTVVQQHKAYDSTYPLAFPYPIKCGSPARIKQMLHDILDENIATDVVFRVILYNVVTNEMEHLCAQSILDDEF